jgi:glyoxylase-like metal-dependent hydrolase (beta-lactamase superfamily II)
MAFNVVTALDDVRYAEVVRMGVSTNVYAVGPLDNLLLFDAGTDEAAPELIDTLEAAGCKPDAVRAIIITHGHNDHYGGALALTEWCGAPVWAHAGAAMNIENPELTFTDPAGLWDNISQEGIDGFRERVRGAVPVGRLLREGDVVEHAGLTFDVLHTPGHQRGLITLYESDRRLAFMGDLPQGGMDSSGNWLGLYHDIAAQRRSLQRVIDLDLVWEFRAHRAPHSGADVAANLAHCMAWLDRIEAALLDALADQSPLSEAQLVRATFRALFDIDVAQPRGYAVQTIKAFMIDLATRGRVRRTDDLEWELVG